MTFPGAGARVFYNDAGEPLGWDYPDYDSPPDPDEFYDSYPERPGWCAVHNDEWFADESRCETALGTTGEACEQPQDIG